MLLVPTNPHSPSAGMVGTGPGVSAGGVAVTADTVAVLIEVFQRPPADPDTQVL